MEILKQHPRPWNTVYFDDDNTILQDSNESYFTIEGSGRIDILAAIANDHARLEGLVAGLDASLSIARAKEERLEKELEALRESEKELSDSYLRIRSLVGAWNTSNGGADRFEITEGKIKQLLADLSSLRAQADALAEASRQVMIQAKLSKPSSLMVPLLDDLTEALSAYRAGKEADHA